MYLMIEIRMRALPCHKKDALDGAVRRARHEILDLAIVVGQHHHRNIQSGALDLGRQFGGAHVFDFEVGDDQVEARIGTRQFQRLRPGLHVRDSRNVLQVELVRFADQQLVQAAVFAQNERVVQAGHQQDVLHPEGHQVLEGFEELFLFDGGFERWIGAHGAIVTRAARNIMCGDAVHRRAGHLIP